MSLSLGSLLEDMLLLLSSVMNTFHPIGVCSCRLTTALFIMKGTNDPVSIFFIFIGMCRSNIARCNVSRASRPINMRELRLTCFHLNIIPSTF